MKTALETFNQNENFKQHEFLVNLHVHCSSLFLVHLPLKAHVYHSKLKKNLKNIQSFKLTFFNRWLKGEFLIITLSKPVFSERSFFL